MLGVEVDTTPQLVHNLEIGGAHTYLAGELEAWAHNAPAPEKTIGTCSIDVGLDLMEDFLGPNYSDEGSGRYRSADGQRQGRLGKHETSNPKKLHCHLEQLKNGRVIFNGRLKLVGK